MKNSNSDIIINPKYIKNKNMQISIRLLKKKIKRSVWAYDLFAFIYLQIQNNPKLSEISNKKYSSDNLKK